MSKKIVAFFAVAAVFLTGISTGAQEVRKVQVIGNSIMKHAPNQALGWNGNYGMAASGEAKDYAHLTFGKIRDAVVAAGQPAPELSLVRVENEAKMGGWEKLVDAGADLIIVQISDNYNGKKDFENFQKPYEQMIRDLSANGREPVVVCVTNWGGGPLNEMIRAAARNCGVRSVDLAPLQKDPANSAGSEGRFTHRGVNWHPGDRGMQAISDAIWQVLSPELSAKLQRK